MKKILNFLKCIWCWIFNCEKEPINQNTTSLELVNEENGVGINLISKPNDRIEKVVYSLWTKPSGNILDKTFGWSSAKAHLLSLSLSVQKSAEIFKEVELITDSEGWKVIKQLELPFTSVKLILDDISEEDYGFWALGKIYAYQAQDKPFIHIDNDAILWKPLPDWVLESEIFVQNTEDNEWFEKCYRAEVNHATKVLDFFPKNWRKTNEAFCTGIFGGTDIEFIKHYCEQAIKFLKDNRNKKGWNSITNKGSYCIIFEQYLLACLCQAHNKNVTFFDKYLNKDRLQKFGYTHIWGAKKEKSIENLLLNSLKNNYPKSVDKVLNLFE